MGNYLAPGVYQIVQDNSFSVPAFANTIFGCVGAARWGAFNEVTTITSSSQFVDAFGKLMPGKESPDTTSVSDMHELVVAQGSYAAYNYLMAGNILNYVRIGHKSDKRLYWNLTVSGLNVTLNLYKDSAKTSLVARYSGVVGTGLLIVDGDSGSGLGGTASIPGPAADIVDDTDSENIIYFDDNSGSSANVVVAGDRGGYITSISFTGITSNNTATGDIAASKASCQVPGTGSPYGKLDLSALYAGTLGNELKVNVAVESGSPTTYKISVLLYDGVVETYRFVDKDNIKTKIGTSSVPVSNYIYVINTTPDFTSLTAGTYSLSGGTDGTTGLDTGDVIGNVTDETGLYAFYNPEHSSCRILAAPGWTTNGGTGIDPVFTAMDTICKYRDDSIFFVGSYYGWDTSDVQDWRDNNLSNTYLGAAFCWWGQMFDTFEGEYRWMCPEGFAIRTYAQSDKDNSFVWVAAAFYKAGKISDIYNVEYNPTQGDIEILYDGGEGTPRGINVFKKDSSGIVIYGLRSLYGVQSRLLYLPVVRMIIQAKVQFKELAKLLLGQAIDERLMLRYVNYGDSVLGPIAANYGLEDYKIICDDTTTTQADKDAGILKGKMLLLPPGYAEFIEVTWVVNNSQNAVSFS